MTMRLLVCFLFIVGFANAQVNTNTVQVKPPAYDFMIEMGCGFAGQTSPELKSVKLLVESKQYNSLKKLLKSKSFLNQLLSVIALDELEKRKSITLNSSEKKRISKIKSSKKSYFLCGGANLHHYGNVKDIFYPNPNTETKTDIAEALRNELGLTNN
ncbi:MAG: hypothetical protein IT236_16105 [Bacteroidia bacterium]|nr:hypothetical protein [Bacteroidia bacterium]